MRKVRLDSGVGMMIRKLAVDIGKQQMMLTREELDELLDHRSRGAVAGVPADPIAAARIAGKETRDIRVDDRDIGHGAVAGRPVARPGQPSEIGDVIAKKRRMTKYHLEAVILGGIVAAGYVDAAIHF